MDSNKNPASVNAELPVRRSSSNLENVAAMREINDSLNNHIQVIAQGIGVVIFIVGHLLILYCFTLCHMCVTVCYSTLHFIILTMYFYSLKDDLD